jgi:hypothetical protein
MSAAAYTQLIQEFTMLLGGETPDIDENSGLEFEHDDVRIKIYAYPDFSKIAVDVEIFKIEESSSAEINEQRFKLLHQLNSLTRYTHGALATLTLDNMLVLGCSAEIQETNAPGLVNMFNNMIQSGLDLRNMWSELWNLIELAQDELNTYQKSPASQMGSPVYA